MPTGGDLSLLSSLSGGIPVALFALVIVVVLWRENQRIRSEADLALRGKDAEYDVMVKVKDADIAALNKRLLDLTSEFSAELLSTHSKLSERMLEQTRENVPLLKQAVDVLRQAVDMIEAQAVKSVRRG